MDAGDGDVVHGDVSTKPSALMSKIVASDREWVTRSTRKKIVLIGHDTLLAPEKCALMQQIGACEAPFFRKDG
eukprot:2130312-Prymnesium_polylepis.1